MFINRYWKDRKTLVKSLELSKVNYQNIKTLKKSSKGKKGLYRIYLKKGNLYKSKPQNYTEKEKKDIRETQKLINKMFGR